MLCRNKLPGWTRPVDGSASPAIIKRGPKAATLADLAAARSQFDGPILAKDFIVDAAQVSEARAHGADAVLVMMSVLGDADAAAVLAEARRLGMDAIVEVHDEAELSRALRLGATIVGINNRDLKTLRTDLAVTERLAPLVPANVLAISESGISNHADVERLAPLVDAFLVGSSLMATPGIAAAARALVHGPVKICGLTRPQDVALAAAAGASYAGFILVPGTPRAVTVMCSSARSRPRASSSTRSRSRNADHSPSGAYTTTSSLEAFKSYTVGQALRNPLQGAS